MGKTLIIAEAGVNHNGSLDTALRLVDAAADAGADYVKFQTFRAENLVSRQAQLAAYQKTNIGSDDGVQYAMLKSLELSADDHHRLIAHARECGIGFCSTPFDGDSIRFLASLHLDFWKIPSGEITNYPYLRDIARCGGKVVMSTGMSTLDQVGDAIRVLTDNGIAREAITLLHCNTQYPTPMCDVNLVAMSTLRERFALPVGYSDHTLGIEVPIAAVALGATVIEKHFTLDRSLPGPDHKASLEPSELREMVSAIRNIEQAVGSGDKAVTASEAPNIAAARKSIVAARPIRRGEIITEESIAAKRPGTWLSPMMWPQVVGTAAIRDFAPDEPIEM